uniref:CDK5 regulatory subunit-associated protein 3 n=1 Tax=Spongospora subterranea TaxID=70186 RepID=A0A0H5R8L9_9EUKA|eukprot:CRZ10146.1 hypothetical protein [Spongospora subterranea]
MEHLDIQYDKLCQWLTERNVIPKNWNDRIAALRSRTESELTKLPPLSELSLIQQADYCGYRECEQIVKILVADDTAKGIAVFSLFGRHNNQQTRLWDNLRSQYTKNNLKLAEFGQRLVQIVKYDIYSLKKEVSTLSKSVEDNHRHAYDKEKHAQLAKTKYEQLCQHYEIDPALPPKPQLQSQVFRLQAYFQEFLNALKRPTVHECIEFFSEFQAFLNSSDDTRSNNSTPKDRTISLKLLMNMTSPVTAAESVSLSMGLTADSHIDEGGMVEIAWGEGNPAEDGNWDISCVEAGVEASQETDIETQGLPEMGKNIVSLLDGRFRATVKTELIFLEHFLLQRCSELENDTHLDVFAETVEGNFLQCYARDLSWTTNTLQYIRSLQPLLDNEVIQRLLKIRSSPSYLDRLVSSFEVQRLLEQKCLEKSIGLRAKADEIRDTIAELASQISNKVSDAVWYKEQAEEALGVLYKGKSIKLIGEIGNVIKLANKPR